MAALQLAVALAHDVAPPAAAFYGLVPVGRALRGLELPQLCAAARLVEPVGLAPVGRALRGLGLPQLCAAARLVAELADLLPLEVAEEFEPVEAVPVAALCALNALYAPAVEAEPLVEVARPVAIVSAEAALVEVERPAAVAPAGIDD